jgi:hypothetical protein
MKILQQSYGEAGLVGKTQTSIAHKFFAWCATQQKNRLQWLAIIITLYGCVITPLTLLFVILSGNSMLFWALTIAAMGMSLAINLAAAPTKVTIPVFFLSLGINLGVIISSIYNGLAFPSV